MPVQYTQIAGWKIYSVVHGIVVVLVLVFDVPISIITAYSVTMASIHIRYRLADHVSGRTSYLLANFPAFRISPAYLLLKISS